MTLLTAQIMPDTLFVGGARIGCDRGLVVRAYQGQIAVFQSGVEGFEHTLLLLCFPMRQMPALRPDARKPVFWGR